MLLHENGEYNEIVDHFMSEVVVSNRIDTITIVIAALYEIGTVDALSKMSVIVNQNQIHSGNTRANFIYSWLAFKLKEYGKSYDILTKKEFKSNNKPSGK